MITTVATIALFSSHVITSFAGLLGHFISCIKLQTRATNMVSLWSTIGHYTKELRCLTNKQYINNMYTIIHELDTSRLFLLLSDSFYSTSFGVAIFESFTIIKWLGFFQIPLLSVF